MGTMDKYLKQLERSLNAESSIKKKILCDMRSDFETYLAKGDTVEQIIEKMGTPEEVAREFNQNYPEYQSNKQKRQISIFTIVCAVVSAVCLSVGLIGKFVYLDSSRVSHIGGADLPTKIVVTGQPISALTLYDGLIKIAVGILFIVLLCACYLFIKYRKKER